MSDNTQINEVCLARQPIYDENLKVYGYELLFRHNIESTESCVVDGDRATTDLIVNTFSDIGFQNVVGHKYAFINLTEKLLMNLPPLPTQQVVLEILEDVPVTDKIITAVNALVEKGYTIALDDYIQDEKWEPLIEKSKIIKIDLMALTKDELESHVKSLVGKNVKLLAEKIETHEEFEHCKELGFKYFQGYFLSKPKIIKGKKTSTNKMVVMQLLGELNKPDANVEEVEKLLSADPKLSYKLLRIINSPAYGLGKEIESVKQAIVLLGLLKLKEWASLLALSSVENKPSELLNNTLVRAKMCQLLAIKLNEIDVDSFFTVGLFSNLAAMLDEEMDDILEKISMKDDIKTALLAYNGRMGQVLKAVIDYERAKWDKLTLDGLNFQDYSSTYMSSIEWAQTISSSLS